MLKTNKRLKIVSNLLIFIVLASNVDYSFASIIKDGEGNRIPWKKADKAYRPNPILFLHGFGSGGPRDTWVGRDDQKEKDKPKLDEKLLRYFENYLPMAIALPGTEKYPQTRFPYLELVSFIDFTNPSLRSQLIDRNSSVDTYQWDKYNIRAQDYYVKTKERAVGDAGWADKLNEAVELLRNNYKDKDGKSQKVTLVCHSMGGLAAREYLTNSKYVVVDGIKEVIFIGTPNLGSSLAGVAKGATKVRRVGWFLPFGIWLFSQTIDGVDKLILEKKMMDIDGDAVRDMDPKPSGSGFLDILNARPQPSNVDYFAIWGNGDGLTDVLVNRGLYNGEGDGVVGKDSQLGAGVLKLKDFYKLDKGSHGNEPLVIANQDNAQPLLKFIDYVQPEVVITSPDTNVSSIPEVNALTVNVKGTVSKEYLPADSILKLEAVREEDGTVMPKSEGKFLYPSDQWNPGDIDSPVAEFDQPFEFTKSGTYTISVTVTNPAGVISDVKTTRIKVIIQNPIISIQSPEASLLTDRRPLIKARIYSPDKMNIDLSSVELKLDGVVVSSTITPETGGSDITISYVPVNDLSVNDPNTFGTNEGKHNIVINAKDKAGLIADEKSLIFEIFALCPAEIVKYMRAINERQKAVGLTQTTFYNRTTGVSLGLPDGGVSVPSLDALLNYPYLSKYIDDLRWAVTGLTGKDVNSNTGAYWDISSNTKLTFSSPWTRTITQVTIGGIEAIDVEEIKERIVKLAVLRLPVKGASSIASYLWYAIADYGDWNGSQYAPNGVGDKLYYPSGLILGDQGMETYPTRYNTAVRGFFGANIKNLSGLSLKDAVVRITASVTSGSPASLGSCHLGYFLPSVSASDFQKSAEADIAIVPASVGTFSFAVTSYVQADINSARTESWYKGWFDSSTNYDKNWDRISWWPIEFIISPAFQNP